MDYLTEVEVELGNFTQALYNGINEINKKSDSLDQTSRIKMINGLSSDLLSAHTSVMHSIGKIPEEIFTASREAQENEINMLQIKYEHSLNKIEKLKSQAKNVINCLEQNLDTL